MDKTTSEYFVNILNLTRSVIENIQHNINITPARAILHIQGKYGIYQIFITELIDNETRQYRYYVLNGSRVEAGFDNAPDPRAIRLKYGKIGKERAGKHIPHLHLNDKMDMQLTEEMKFEDFIQWLKCTIH